MAALHRWGKACKLDHPCLRIQRTLRPAEQPAIFRVCADVGSDVDVDVHSMLTTLRTQRYQEIHIGADIVFEASQYWRLTGKRNKTWATLVGLPLASAVADYYASRAAPRKGDADQHALHLDNVMGPDERHGAVNDSAYDSGAAVMALKFAVELATTPGVGIGESAAVGDHAGGAPPAALSNVHNTTLWGDVASHLVIPYEASRSDNSVTHPSYREPARGH